MLTARAHPSRWIITVVAHSEFSIHPCSAVDGSFTRTTSFLDVSLVLPPLQCCTVVPHGLGTHATPLRCTGGPATAGSLRLHEAQVAASGPVVRRWQCEAPSLLSSASVRRILAETRITRMMARVTRVPSGGNGPRGCLATYLLSGGSSLASAAWARGNAGIAGPMQGQRRFKLAVASQRQFAAVRLERILLQ